MFNKKLFIIPGLIILLLFGYIFFTRNKKENFSEVPAIEENETEISKENIEEAKVLFSELEETFYNILENIFLRGEDVTRLLSEEIIEIENNLKSLEAGLEEETISGVELNEKLSTIQAKMQLLVEKLIEIDS
jgi:flagellar motility protein MotE (MotC chaperone)